jgi:phosphocarrier protein HPr
MNEWPDEAGETKAATPPHSAATLLDPSLCGCGEAGGMTMRRVLRITNSRGLHARAAAKLVTVAERFSACVNVSCRGQSVPACSIMGLMMLGAGQGAEIAVEAEGWDAKEALEAIAGLVEAGFHED